MRALAAPPRRWRYQARPSFPTITDIGWPATMRSMRRVHRGVAATAGSLASSSRTKMAATAAATRALIRGTPYPAIRAAPGGRRLGRVEGFTAIFPKWGYPN